MIRLACYVAIVALLGLACALPGHETAEVPAWELPPPAALDRPVVDAAKLTRTRLDNGLSILVLQDRRLPRVDLGITARRGAADEPIDRAGLASFTGELMERGAGERTALELAAVVDDLGASLGVGATWDSMNAAVSGLSRDRETLFAVLTDVVRRPRFDDDEAERVRAERLAALERATDEPEVLVRWGLYHGLYSGHRYGLPVEGNATSVASLDAAAARAFHQSVFTPAGCILWAVGDVDPDAIVAAAREAFGDWPASPLLAAGPAPPATTPDATRVVVIDRPDLGQAQIAVGHEGTARADERRMAVSILNTVLGAGGFSSRLMSRVRADEGLTYSIGSSFGQRRQPGPFAVRTFTRVPETRRVVDLVLAEMGRMQTEPPAADELGRAQSLRTGSFGLGLETSRAVASALVEFDVYGLPEDSLDTYRGRVRATSTGDVEAVADSLLHPTRALVVVVGPAAELEPQLESLGPVEAWAP